MIVQIAGFLLGKPVHAGKTGFSRRGQGEARHSPLRCAGLASPGPSNTVSDLGVDTLPIVAPGQFVDELLSGGGRTAQDVVSGFGKAQHAVADIGRYFDTVPSGDFGFVDTALVDRVQSVDGLSRPPGIGAETP